MQRGRRVDVGEISQKHHCVENGVGEIGEQEEI